nr:MAG TPA: hypothetical protein [Caudoviricetes sp.]
MIISLSRVHIFANPSIARYTITDLINLLSSFHLFSCRCKDICNSIMLQHY